VIKKAALCGFFFTRSDQKYFNLNSLPLLAKNENKQLIDIVNRSKKELNYLLYKASLILFKLTSRFSRFSTKNKTLITDVFN